MSETVKISTLQKIISDIDRRVSFIENRLLYTKIPWKAPQLTTTERDALDAENGDLIYNTTTNRFEGYENSTWVDL